MTFFFHMTLALDYIALVSGAILVIWALRNPGNGSAFANAVGSIIFLLSVVSIFATLYYGSKYWVEGDYETPFGVTLETQKKMLDHATHTDLSK
ncbi:MAG: hypothetical protein K2P93_04845 [Alphaproteobacteria bacterium]|nr:hypothetical protein [Alphaproteobacteria bacterium]